MWEHSTCRLWEAKAPATGYNRLTLNCQLRPDKDALYSGCLEELMLSIGRIVIERFIYIGFMAWLYNVYFYDSSALELSVCGSRDSTRLSQCSWEAKVSDYLQQSLKALQPQWESCTSGLSTQKNTAMYLWRPISQRESPNPARRMEVNSH